MKKFLLLAITVITGLTLSACSALEDLNNTVSTLSSSESLAVLSYVSGTMLDTESTDPNASSNLTFLNETDEPSIYDEMENINVYVDRLKVFIESGTEDFGNIQAQVSENPDYMYEININIEENEYVIYYNIDEAGVLSGVMVIGEETYELTVLENKLKDKNELDVEDNDDELDEEEDVDNDDELDDEENEVKMTLLATNGENTIRIKYKAETEENESKTVIEMEKNMNGVESFSSIEIKEEDNEYKVTVREDGLELQFKAETEDGETEYKLNYSNEGVEGEIRIKAEYNEDGELVYRYQIKEQGKNYQYEQGAPRSRGFNPVEEEETEETETGDNV